MRLLQAISDAVNDRSGKVMHEITADGRSTSAARTTDRGQHGRDGQVPEHRRADLALDRRRPVPRPDVRLRQAQPAIRRRASSTRTRTAGPRGSATSSATGMGDGEARQRRLLHPRPLRPRRPGAVQGRRRHGDVGPHEGRRPRHRFDAHVVDAGGETVRRLARRTATSSISRSTGSASTPMEAELTVGRRAPCPAWPRSTTAPGARPCARTDCFSGTPPYNRGLFHTGCGGGPEGKGERDDLLAQHRDPGGRRGQLRPPRRRPAAALHRRQRRADVRRAGGRRHARRAARRDAGDPARRRTSTPTARRTSTAAGPAARCSCRPGATTARPGRSSTSSSACARTWAAAASPWCRSCPRPRRSRAGDIRLGDGCARSSCGRRATVTATRRRSATGSAPVEAARDRPYPAARLPGSRRSSSTASGARFTRRQTNRGEEITRADQSAAGTRSS